MGLRDMFSAISGLQANSTWLDVIGNNISNTNTVAYKSSRVEFSDQFSQTLFGGTGDNTGSNLGGVNPEQIGLGTRVASIQTIFTEGTLQTTGLSTDIAIVGSGFLVAKSGTTTLLTRAGNLNFDSQGNLVDQNGGLIQGFTASTQYQTKVLQANAVPANDLLITSNKLVLNNQNPTAATNITIPRTMTLAPNATTVVNFAGNLDSFLQATDSQHGGVYNLGLGTAATPATLPLGMAGLAFTAPAVPGAVFNLQAPAGAVPPPGNVLHQNFDANTGAVGNPDPNSAGNEQNVNRNNWTNAFIATPVGNVDTVKNAAAGTTNFVWDQVPPQPPAHQVTETVYDSEGTPRAITINFYQVNDLGAAGTNAVAGPNQVAYAWYAFDTTNGKTATTPNLLGGTGIQEANTQIIYNRGTLGAQFMGDLLVYNTDGSLLSTGGAENNGDMSVPNLYIPPDQTNPPTSPIPTQGAQITQISLDFGTAGILGQGLRDGSTSDAEGSYQVVNGVNTYIPNSTIFAKTQDGYAEGQLSSIQFDATGTINGTFTNGQTLAVGQVIMAMPNNPDGLSKVGNNYYQPSPNAGPMFVGLAGQEGMGTVQGSTLELSNVDLTVELSNMIIAQRGFDVNSRVISVENSNLQILSQLGQGG